MTTKPQYKVTLFRVGVDYRAKYFRTVELARKYVEKSQTWGVWLTPIRAEILERGEPTDFGGGRWKDAWEVIETHSWLSGSHQVYVRREPREARERKMREYYGRECREFSAEMQGTR